MYTCDISFMYIYFNYDKIFRKNYVPGSVTLNKLMCPKIIWYNILFILLT